VDAKCGRLEMPINMGFLAVFAFFLLADEIEVWTPSVDAWGGADVDEQEAAAA
jgi:hypothetical protein